MKYFRKTGFRLWLWTVLLFASGLWGPCFGLFGEPPASSPRPHPLVRYRELWEQPWFQRAAPSGEEQEKVIVPPVFPFRLSGVAEWRGNACVYLLDERNVAHELSIGNPRGDLELLSVHFGDAGAIHKAEVRYRTDLFDLEFDLKQNFGATPSSANAPAIHAPLNVRVKPVRPQTSRPSRRNVDSPMKRKRGDGEARDWFDGWFRD